MNFYIQCHCAYYPKFKENKHRDDEGNIYYWGGTYINHMGTVEFDIYPPRKEGQKTTINLTAHILKEYSYRTSFEYTGYLPSELSVKRMCNSYLKAVHEYINI